MHTKRRSHPWAWTFVLVVGIFLLAPTQAMGDTEVTYSFKAPALSGAQETTGRSRAADDGPVHAAGEFVSIDMPETLKFADRPGVPLLPVKTAKILIPFGENVGRVRVIPGKAVVLPGAHNIEYSRPPSHSAAGEEVAEEGPDPSVYGSINPFPGTLFKVVSTQMKRGARILIVNLFPVQYRPSSGEVSYYENLRVIVETTRTEQPAGEESSGQGDLTPVAGTVDNPSELKTYPGMEVADDGSLMMMRTAEPPYTYVIITNSSLESSFEVLAAHKNSRGISATVVTTTWVYENYSGTRPDGGTDNQTRIRNFIIDAYNNWGTEYVLLGGDDEVIPHRGCYGYVSTFPSPTTDNDIPTDLYYACLDGTWDNDADGIYGESNDGAGGSEIDLMSEVYVGRATVDNTTEADNFIFKTMAYEQGTPSQSGLMTGTQLYHSPLTWGGDHKDEIAAYFSSGWDITTLYERDGTCSSTTVVNALNSNDHSILNSAGHGNNGGFSNINRTHVDGLTNTSYPFVYTWACYTASFDNRTSSGSYESDDCIAEHFVENATGAFAYVGNSRYGWYSRGSTGGTSQQFDKTFFDSFFNEGITNLGKTLVDSKEDLIGSVGSTGAYRWVYFCLNLLGDPETSLQGGVAPKASILFFSSFSRPSEVARLQSLGYAVTESSAPADLTLVNLRNYDILMIYLTASADYSTQNTEIRNWVREERGGLIVVQPDETGSVSVFPAGFEVSVGSIYLPSTSAACITNDLHPITYGLVDADMSGNFDQVEDTDIGPSWDILARDCDDTSQVVLLAGVYGSGRLVFNTHNFSRYSMDSGSDQFLEQMIEWALTGNRTSVLVAAADDVGDAVNLLKSYPDLGPVYYFDARTGTPSLDLMHYYDVVMTWTNYTYSDAVAMGDALADYVDTGGKVLLNMFSMGTHTWRLQGRFMGEQYSPINGGAIDYSDADLGSYDPTHPLMQGVGEVSDYYRLQDTYLTPGSRWVARWSDGELLAAVKECGRVAAITSYPGINENWEGDMMTLMHNAVQWLTGKVSVLTATADSATNCNSILGMLKQDPGLGPILQYDAQYGTPGLGLLESFPVVMTWTNYHYNDPVAMGDVLADYVDGGGKALTTMFALGTHGWAMEGRFADQDYGPIEGEAIIYSPSSLGTYDPDHPIMNGVSTASAGYRLADTSLTADATEVARWADGELFVGVKNDRSTAAVAAYPAFSWTGDLDNVIWNSINWLGASRPVIEAVEFDSCISELCRSNIHVHACDPAGGTLSYVWQALDEGVISGSGPSVAFDPPNAPPHAYPARVKVTVTSSATGLSASSILNITVKLGGDANGSGRVDILDKRIVRDAYGSTPFTPNWDPRADVNCSGRVDILDKRVVRDQYGWVGLPCRPPFCEDFNDGVANSWVTDGSGLWSVQEVEPGEGVYVMEGNGGSTWRYSTYSRVYKDFTYEADVTRTVGNDNAFNGIIFRSDGTQQNCYQFGTDLDLGWFWFGKYVGGVFTWITSWSDSPAINRGLGTWNRLKAVCSGPNISVYINDVLVGSFVDTSHSEGRVGVICADFSGDVVQWDNACVSLDSAVYEPGTTSAPVPTGDPGNPCMTPENREAKAVEPPDREAPEPLPVSDRPPAVGVH